MNYHTYSRLKELGISLSQSGKQTCPKCSHERQNKTDKCLSVTFKENAVVFYCHHCGWTGSVQYQDNIAKKQYNRPAEFKSADNTKPLIDYFAKRGISAETLNKYNVTMDNNGRIVFPYYKNGILVNIKTRQNLENGKKTFTQTKDAEKTFFGIDLVKGQENLIIVEGEVDVLSLAEQGIYSVSVPQGGSDTKLECLGNCDDDFLTSFKNFIIAVDNDEVGNKLKNTLLSRFPKDKCKVVNWLQYKDANEVLVAGEDLHKYIKDAKYVQTDGIYTFDESSVWDKVYEEIFEIDKNFYSTGWKKLDEYIKLKTGHLMVVTGYPSRGKSTFVDNLLINLAKRYPDKMKHLIASFENTFGNYYKTLFEMYMQKSIYKIKNEYQEDALNEIMFTEAFDFINEHFILFDNERMWNIDEICERTEIEVMKHGIKTLVIDPYNRLNNDYKDREDKYIGNILSKLCMLSKRLDILVIFVAHPKKPDAKKTPTMYSISGSGDWYNMSDYGIIVHRERNTDGKLANMPQITIAKVKNFSLGNPSGGVINMYYDVDKRIITE